MRVKWFWLAALTVFFVILTSSFWKRVLALSLSALLGTTSPAGWLLTSGDTATATPPPIQIADLFRNDNSNQPPAQPGTDIFSSPTPPASNPSGTGIDIFTNPNTPSTTPQSQPPSPQPNRRTGGSTSGASEPCYAKLLQSSAQPAQQVEVSGVPLSYTNIAARVQVEGRKELYPTIARRLSNGNLSVGVPIHPTNGTAGGSVQLLIANQGEECPTLALTVQPLAPAPGTTQRMIAKEQELFDQVYRSFGISRSDVLSNPQNIPPALSGLIAAQYFLDHPQNPNSFKAILNGTAPLLNGQKIDQQVLDSILANVGFLDVLDSGSRQINETLSTYTSFLQNPPKTRTARQKLVQSETFMAQNLGLSHKSVFKDSQQASALQNLVQWGVASPDRFATLCKAYDYGSTAQNENDPDYGLYQLVSFMVGLVTTVVGIAFPPLAFVSTGASLGMLAMSMMTKAVYAWMPFYVSDFNFDVDKTSLDLERDKLGKLTRVSITTRSKGGDLDISDLLDLIFNLLGVKSDLKNAENATKLAKLKNSFTESEKIWEQANDQYIRAFQAKNNIQGLPGRGLTTVEQVGADLNSAQRQRDQAFRQLQDAKKALFDERKRQDAMFEKVADVVEKIEGIVNSFAGYTRNMYKATYGELSDLAGKVKIPILSIDYPSVVLYSVEKPNLKYLSLQTRRPAINLSTPQSVYQATNQGDSDLVVAPKLGSTKGACETWASETKKVGSVEHAKRIYVNEKEREAQPPVASGNLRQGRSYGDPHIVTFDGYRYSFQTVGEFTLVQAKDGGFQVQVRQGAVPGRQLSLNTGVAMQVGNSRVAVYSKDFPDGNASTPVWVDGRPTSVQGTLELSGGGSIQGGNGNYLVQWPSGEQVGISKLSVAGMEFMNVTPAVPEQAGRYVGLLGDLDNNPENDLQTRGGQVILTKDNSTYGILKQALGNLGPIPIPLNQIETAFFEQLYREFGDSWRISQAESLFAYGPGQSTESFTNRGFPSSFSTLGSLLPPQLRQAEEICRQAGVPGDLLEGCIFDVGNTGEGGFAQAALNTVLDEVKNRVEAEIRNRIPIPVPIPLPF